MSNTGDIRYGESPFPYGDMYDRGISLDKIVGVASDPLGLTEGTTYVAITLHKNYSEYAANAPVSGERTIYIAQSLFSGLITIRLGESFQSTSAGYISGQIAGVMSGGNLIGLFSWRISNGTLEWFPDSALTVFDSILTPAAIDGTTWGGEDAYNSAVNGAPLYYFVWDSEALKLDGPVRRVLPEDIADRVNFGNAGYGVFVPTIDGVPQSPIPAAYFGDGGQWASSMSCTGYITVFATTVTSSTGDVAVGSAAVTDESAWGPGASAGVFADNVQDMSDGAPVWKFSDSFLNAFEDGHVAGYFFRGWYNPALGIADTGQNTDYVALVGETELQWVYLLTPDIEFAGGTAETPNNVYLNLAPATGQTPSLTATIEFAVDAAALTANGTSSGLLASAYTGSGGSTTVYCYGNFFSFAAINLYDVKKIEYNTLASGSVDGQFLVWDNTLGEWTAGDSPLPDGSNNGQLLMWNATAATPAWMPGPFGTATGQILEWDGTAWVPGDGGDLPTAADKDTLFYDGTTGVSAWVANPTLKWSMPISTGGVSTGGILLLDMTGHATRAWDAQMPGLAMNHPSGGTCGVYLNLESGTDAGPRLDMGWGGANGGNFELYSNAHPTRPGEFRIIYGPTGHIEFKNYRGTTDWDVTAGLTKEGRFFCGFNDTGFPGSADTVGTYAAPPYPFQVFDETSQASKMTAGITKEGRGFFGLGGTMPTAGVEHPLEVYNETGTGVERVIYLSKTGKILTQATVSALAHTAQLDCNDIAMSTAAAAQEVKLREMVVPYKSGAAVKGKLAQVLCGAGYGDELDLGGRPATPTDAVVRGATTETDLSSSTAYDPATPDSGKDGLTIYVSLGSYYDDTAGTPVLKEYRIGLTWPNAIAPKITAAYTVSVDTPQA